MAYFQNNKGDNSAMKLERGPVPIDFARELVEEALVVTDESPRLGLATTATKPALVIQLTVDTLLAMDKLEPLLTTTLVRARRPS